MSKKPNQSAKPAELRRAAEARFKTQGPNPQTAADPQRLQHELEVQQIELELQNQELQAAQARLETALDEYTAL